MFFWTLNAKHTLKGALQARCTMPMCLLTALLIPEIGTSGENVTFRYLLITGVRTMADEDLRVRAWNQ